MQTEQRQKIPILQNQVVVVFSKNYLPLARINLKRAVVLLVAGQAETLEFSSTQQWEVRSQERRTTNSGSHPLDQRQSRGTLENSSCESSGNLSPRQPHLPVLRQHQASDARSRIPRSKGGTHTWDNVVTACEKCNSSKGDRLLHETPMVLRTKPKAPMHPAIAFAEQFWKEQQPIEP